MRNNHSLSKSKDIDLHKIYGYTNGKESYRDQSPGRRSHFEKKDFRITKQLRQIQSAKSQNRAALTQQHFREQINETKEQIMQRRKLKLKEMEE